MSTVEKTEVIGPRMAGTLMTLEEFDSAQEWDENYRYELVNGVLVVTPPASIQERGPNDYLGYMLRLYADRHPQGKKFLYTASEQTIRTLHSRRRADRVIWIGLGRMPRERTDTPTVAVEFVSPGRRSRVRDYTAKRAEYAEVGISEYWIIDRFRRRLTVIRMANGEQAELVFVEGDTYRTPLMPGFELSVSSLFEESDLLEAEGNDDDDLAP